jgi:tetratricopeptide (TPR) repeat protein
MKKGDGKRALYWLEKSIDYDSEFQDKEKLLLDKSKIELIATEKAYALELDNQYEEAMSILKIYRKHYAPDIARLYYKIGKKEKAFDEYCNIIEFSNGNDMSGWIYFVERFILLKDSYFLLHLSIFNNCEDFMNFMEQEYKILGMPSQYQRAMSTYREIATQLKNCNRNQQ